MELLLVILTVLMFASLVGLSMIAFAVGIKSLKKVNLLEDKFEQIKNKKN
jgi:hypothetical protein